MQYNCMDMRKLVGDNVCRIRKRTGLTQEKLSESSGLSAKHALENHDSHRFFGAIDHQIITGPTMTNVNDFRAILIEPALTLETI